jgi:predicted acyl esterase
MLEAEQFLCAEKPWVSIKYMNSNEENAFFKMEGWRNLLTDLNVFCKSSANVKATMQMLKQALMQNNTAGGSLYELAQVGLSNSPAELISKLKKADEDRKAQVEQQQKHEQEMQQQQQQFLEKERIAQEQRDDYWKQKQMELDLQMAEIKAAGYSTEDLNANQQSDALDFIKEQNKQITLNDKMSLEQRKHDDKLNLERQKIDLKRQQILSDQMIQNKEAEDVRILKGLSVKNQNKKK